MTSRHAIAAFTVALAFAGAARAHVAIVEASGLPGGAMTVTFRISHGCKTLATTGLRVELPPGVVAQTIAKPGWNTVVSPATASAPATVTWRGGPSPERTADTFPLGLRLPSAAGPLYFPADQICGDQTVRWGEIPPRGSTTGALSHPAPVLIVGDAPAAPTGMAVHHHDP
ncbi:MAG TPA: DUF1775 domain-containing protein [Caulobacteraceae bacterium]|jgi:uncharacterized protein YcnI|nr:DUF1775 domain-containing protein [Caulobacteraceae bacterium]